MLGTGTWHLKIGNMFYSGDITLRVFDDGGKYGFEIIEPKMTAPEVEIKRLSTAGNHLSATGTARELRGRDAQIELDFTDISVSGSAKVPLIGTVTIKDRHPDKRQCYFSRERFIQDEGRCPCCFPQKKNRICFSGI